MSAKLDRSKQSDSKKRSLSPAAQGSGSPRSKQPKVDEELGVASLDSNERRVGDGVRAKDGSDSKKQTELPGETRHKENEGLTVTPKPSKDDDGRGDTQECTESDRGDVQTSDAAAKVDADGGDKECRPSTSQERSDSAAIAAAEALASLVTRGNGDNESKERPCSSKQAAREKFGDKRGSHEPNRPSCSKESAKPERGQQTEAAAADSSSSLLSRADREGVEQMPDLDDDDLDDSLPASSSTPSSSLASDNDDNEDGECAIVSVKMAPEIRQSVSLLAQVQMRLDALEKKGARLHQRLELKLGRQRRPHLDQRSAITQAIPGFWVTALLNHPHLSAHIDENDEDALSYMTNLEIESFKNNKLGYRIGFHFRRNPYFQNNMIVKELHLGMGGSPVSFSNPILWHRGQNLTGRGEPRRSARGVYQSFFSWFSDHSSPGRDDIAQILKEDLYRNPLRYYLTPLWEPRENGSAPKTSDNSKGDDCVVISDSDDDQEEAEASQALRRQIEMEEEEEDEDEERVAGSDDSELEAGESSCEEKDEEDVDVEEVEESRAGREVRGQDEDEEDIEVDEEDES